MALDLLSMKLWRKSDPNPPKAATLLEEFDVPLGYMRSALAYVKKSEFQTVNPNCRARYYTIQTAELPYWNLV
ncbi:uncharacterized protein V1518DRAFT_34773 [Limtongia smithiae]|uniref:uncharacterized protein n=1 Tax=Limtongia smithiae TaxID=1125753 RepID=UPI0034CE4FC8